jgi:hypothetical protein
MAGLASLLSDPNYTGANAATKQAIFDKFAPQDPNFVNANPETQLAIRSKFGLEVAPSGGIPVGRTVAAPQKERGFLSTIGAPIEAVSQGVIKGVGDLMFGGQKLVGKGLQEVGADEVGRFLQEDAARRQAESQRVVAPFKQAFPIATGTGELGSQALITAPLGGVIAKPLAALSTGVPAVARYVDPVVNALRSSGFSSGLIPTAKAVPGVAPQAIPLATRAADIGARIVGGGVTGGATAALTNADETGTGAQVGAGLAVVAPKTVKLLSKSAGFLTDAFTGRLAEVGAGKISREVAGERIGAIRAALAAAPDDLNAAQAASGVQRDAWQAFGAMLGKTDQQSLFLKKQFDDELALAQRMAEGGNATEARAAYEQSIKRLNQLTADMRNVELQAANQAGQTINRLAPQMEQRQAGMVNALRGGIPVGQPLPGQAVISPATEAAQRRVAAQAQGNRFLSQGSRAQEWQETSDVFANIANQRRAEAGFLERQIGSLEDYGLRPLDAGAITGAIDAKLAQPGLRASSNVTNVLQAVKDDIANLTAKGGGVIDAHDLYTLRKEGINERIMQIMGQTDPKISAKVTRQVLQEVRPLIDDAIEKAGGTGWRDYLKTYSQGMQAIDQKALAAEAARLFKDSPQEYVRLVRGNNPDAVEAIFGPGSYDIFKEMGSKMPTLEKLAASIERTASMKEAATAGTEALGKIIGEDSFRLRFPSLLNRATTAANLTLDILEKRLDKKIFAQMQKGMVSGKSALEMLDTLPAAERNKVLRALTDPASWGKAGPVAARAAVINSLAPPNENRIQLNNMAPGRP